MERSIQDVRKAIIINLLAFLFILFTALTATVWVQFYIMLTVASGVGLFLNIVDYILSSLRILKNA